MFLFLFFVIIKCHKYSRPIQKKSVVGVAIFLKINLYRRITKCVAVAEYCYLHIS